MQCLIEYMPVVPIKSLFSVDSLKHCIGAQKSCHSQSSFVLARKMNNDSDCLVEIKFFLECFVSQGSSNHSSHWVAAVNWFMDHPCKVWYGNPAQVWSTAQFPGYSYILVSDIVSRVVYTKSLCDFGPCHRC